MGDRKHLFKGLVWRPEGESPLRGEKCRWEVKMDLQEGGWVILDWIDLAEDRDRRQAFFECGYAPLGSIKFGEFCD